MRNLLKKGTVIDSLIYIVAYASPDFSITQIGNLASLRIGIKNASKEQSENVLEASALSWGDISIIKLPITLSQPSGANTF